MRGAAFAFALGLGILLERVAPHARSRPAWRANLGLWAIDGAAIGLICGACACTVAGWAGRTGIGLFNEASVSPLLATVATIVALDGVSYAWHRANHRVAFLWRFHRVHHRDASFNVSTALRFHPGELLLSLPLRLVSIVALGAPVSGVVFFEVVFALANILEHGNFNLPARLERRLSALLVTPALHRRHHSCEPNELDTNFGTVLTVWDRALRTRFESSSSDRVRTGLPGGEPEGWYSLRRALVEPFSS